MNIYDVYSLFDVAPVRGEGAYVFDKEGKKYLDFYGGHAVISIGHSHPHYVKSITDQLNEIGFYSNSVKNPLQKKLAEKLEQVSGVKGYDLFLINSGAEANENAIKLASFYNQRKAILALENSFHGRTSGAINITHTGRKHQAMINSGIDVTYCHYKEVEKMMTAISSGSYSSVILECIQGVGGLDMISTEALLEISKACEESDTILIMDEVQCGYGRSGKFYAYQYANVQPDIITMAKGMGNGFPIGGVLINSAKMPPVKSRLGTTYGGNYLACAAALAVLDVIHHENLLDNVTKMNTLLTEMLSDLPDIKRVKGKGLMLGLEFEFEVSPLRKQLVYEHQLFTGSSSNPNLLRLLPPLNIGTKECELFINKMHNALS